MRKHFEIAVRNMQKLYRQNRKIAKENNTVGQASHQGNLIYLKNKCMIVGGKLLVTEVTHRRPKFFVVDPPFEDGTHVYFLVGGKNPINSDHGGHNLYYIDEFNVVRQRNLLEVTDIDGEWFEFFTEVMGKEERRSQRLKEKDKLNPPANTREETFERASAYFPS